MNKEIKETASMEEDPNYLAYIAMDTQLKEKYMGKWIAFYEGQFAGVGEDENALLNRLHETTGHGGFMCVRVTDNEEQVLIRTPRIVR
jgi:hypothetical protein